MTITYEYEDALYVNLTNKCNCNCEFCLRHGRKEGSIYTEDSLWLEREPTRQEALDSFLSRDVCSYREIVFCGYGEPTYRIEDILWLVDQMKERFGGQLPPVRINTNGHANLIHGRDVIPELTYEQFLNFHRTYYHPSNSYIYLYGDMDMEEKLRWLDENYLSAFDAIEVVLRGTVICVSFVQLTKPLSPSVVAL